MRRPITPYEMEILRAQARTFSPRQVVFPEPQMTPAEAAMLQRIPEWAARGFPHPGHFGDNAGIEAGRDNPFMQGGPASAYGQPSPAGGMSLPIGQAQTPEEVADLRSPFQRTSVIGLSANLLPQETEELVRVFTKSQVGSRGIALHWSIRPGPDLVLGDSIDARVQIIFGAGGAQMAQIAPDLGCGSIVNDGSAIPEPTGFGGFGGSCIVPGSFVSLRITNTGASPNNHRTTVAAMASIAETARNPQPVYTTMRATLAAAGAAGDSTTIAIPPYASHLIVYRTAGVTFTYQVLRYLGVVTAVTDFVVPAATLMEEIALPNGSSRLSLVNNGAVASNFSAMFRLNI